LKLTGDHVALIWQAMRHYMLEFVKGTYSGGGSGKEITEADIIAWANGKVKASGKPHQITSSFRDKSIASSHYLIDLLNACDSRSINYDYVRPGADGACFFFQYVGSCRIGD
jgi:plastin-1